MKQRGHKYGLWFEKKKISEVLSNVLVEERRREKFRKYLEYIDGDVCNIGGMR